MEYAAFLGHPIYILSAKHHLLPLDREIEWYDKYLPDFPRAEQVEWARTVADRLRELYDLEDTNFIFLAGSVYSRDLKTMLPHCETPLQDNVKKGEKYAGSGMGCQKNYMNEQMGIVSKSKTKKQKK